MIFGITDVIVSAVISNLFIPTTGRAIVLSFIQLSGDQVMFDYWGTSGSERKFLSQDCIVFVVAMASSGIYFQPSSVMFHYLHFWR